MRAVAIAFTIAVAAATIQAADQTWTGQLSDDMCGAQHMAGEHGKKMSARDCTIACVKDGSKYVFVTGGKVFRITNQDFKTLATYAGEPVKLTGQLKDEAITVSKIERAAKTGPSR
jgi:hypothetical protein